jgi:radical SAM protein with 4Fe4S-binding SPASM domain
MMHSENTAGFDGFPFILGWELTLACNLRCGHCGSTAGLARKGELSTEEALALCDSLPQMLVQEVDFTGGEPLLREDWPLLAKRLSDRGITVKMVTNGILLNNQTVKSMQAAGITAVGVSIDGLESTHDYIRGRSMLFNDLMSKIRETIDAGMSLTVITSVNHMNLPELPRLQEKLLASGVRNWRLQPIFPLGRACHGGELFLSEEDFLNFGKFVKEWKPRAKADGMEMRTGDAFGYFTELDEADPPWFGCPAGLFSCGITSDGGIKGCLSMPDELVEGNLRDRDFWDIWFDPKSFRYNRGDASQCLGVSCNDCDKADPCRGGCSAMSYANTGEFHNDPYCFYGIGKKRGIDKYQV